MNIARIVTMCLCVFGARASVLETHQNIEREGYIAQTHNVTTTDGYILEMHRIPFKRNETSGLADRPVVLLMHGLMSASNSYIALGREHAIAFNLADAGFDVWMGNARGNRYSRNHVTMNPDVENIQFFDFTWNEIGMYDLASKIDYILEHIENKRLHYIGHSQGGTAFLVLASKRPMYNEKIASAHLLAGVGYQEHFPHPTLANMASFTNAIWRLALSLGFVELLSPSTTFPWPEGNNISEASKFWDNCGGNFVVKDLCRMIRAHEFTDSSNDSAIEIAPGGASLKQYAHYGQNVHSKIFREWDYGTWENMQQYGHPEPPIYNLSLITVPVTMHYTINDDLLDERDVHAMARDMPNTVVRRVARDTFQHSDFVASHDVRELVTDHIVHAITNFRDDTEIGPGTPDDNGPGASTTIVLSFVIKIYLVIYSLYCIFY